MNGAEFQVFVDGAGEWRWRLRAANGETIAVSEGYESRQGADRGIQSVKVNAGQAPVVFVASSGDTDRPPSADV